MSGDDHHRKRQLSLALALALSLPLSLSIEVVLVKLPCQCHIRLACDDDDDDGDDVLSDNDEEFDYLDNHNHIQDNDGGNAAAERDIADISQQAMEVRVFTRPICIVDHLGFRVTMVMTLNSENDSS